MQKQHTEKAQKARLEGKEAWPAPTPGISLLAVSWVQAEQDGWVAGSLRRELLNQLGPWLAAILVGYKHCSLLADRGPAVGATPPRDQEPSLPSCLSYRPKY